MTKVAFLRGVNVGGHAKVEMARLKQLFEALGCTSVITYINSGNIIFNDERTAVELVSVIEAAILKEFGITVPVVVRTRESIQRLCEQIPESWMNDYTQKTDVFFLLPEIDDPDVLEKVQIDPAKETMRYYDGALLWNVSREQAASSQARNLIKTKLYKYMTIRNVNTVRQLNGLMQSRAI